MARPELYEDIYYQICDHVAADSGLRGLQDLAVTSRLLAGICREHLFRRVTLDIHQAQDIAFFGQILDRDPRTATVVREVRVRDVAPPILSLWPPRVVVGYGNVTSNWSPLAFCLSRLINIHTADISFAYTFCGEDRTPLGWTELSETLCSLILNPIVTTVKLEGIRHIPQTASINLAQKGMLYLSRCTFAKRIPLHIIHLTPTPTKSRLKFVKIVFPTVDDLIDPFTEDLSPLNQWWIMHCLHIATIPPICALNLTLGAYNSIAEAARFLVFFGPSTRCVAIDTNQACLEALQVRELYDMARDGKLASWPLVSSLRVACVPTILSLGHGTPRNTNDTVALDLKSIDMALANPVPDTPLPAVPLEMLCYRIMNWDRTPVVSTLLAAPAAAPTTEFSWLVSSVHTLPPARNNTIQTLKLDFVVGTHMLDAQRASNALTALVNDDEWYVLAETLNTRGWAALREVRLGVVIPGGRSAWGNVMDVLWESAGVYLSMFLRARLRQEVAVVVSPCASP